MSSSDEDHNIVGILGYEAKNIHFMQFLHILIIS